jgi:hypothetical protein
MINMASQVSGEANAVIPVQDQTCERLAVSLAPRF